MLNETNVNLRILIVECHNPVSWIKCQIVYVCMYYVCIYIYNYVSIPQINAIIIFFGVVYHYGLKVCSHALCLLTLTHATPRAHLLENVVVSFLYNAHITVQG